MAKARARTAARKVKDRWKAKNWYQILAPTLFDQVPVSETLADRPSILINRITEVSLQDLTNDFRKSHIKLFFQIYNVEDTKAYTQFVGHTLTSDYLRRMIRRRRSRIDGIYDVTTRDGAILRVKPFATTERRVQSSQKKLIREMMKKTVTDGAKTKTLNEFIRDAIDGKIGSDIYKNCKHLYPVKRVEIHKTEIQRQPTIEIEDKKPEPKEEEPKEQPETETKEQPEEKPITTDEKEEESIAKKQPEKPAKKEEKPKKTPAAKKPVKAKKPAKKTTTTKKKPVKKESKPKKTTKPKK